MSDVSLEVYLFFNGQAKEAMEFYRSVFGGELTSQSYKEVPNMEAGHPDWLMHSSLEGGMIKLMASDTEGASAKMAKASLSLGGTDEEKMRKVFDALSAGGEVGMPLKKEFWGDIFGQFTDKYGVDWMMNIGQPAA